MKKQKWEIANTNDWGDAEKLAINGWELVSVVLNINNRTNSGIYIYYFKRILKI